MTEQKHTPGPWTVGGTKDVDWFVDTDGENSFVHIGPKGKKPVCIAVVDVAIGKDRVLDANAHLIAAAPDLLEALKEARDHIAGSAPDWHYRTKEMLATIDKAIAKAEGKE